MAQKSTGPYHHYQRPSRSRTAEETNNSGGGRSWAVVIVCLLVIIIALVPVVHHISQVRRQEQARQALMSHPKNKQLQKRLLKRNKTKVSSSLRSRKEKKNKIPKTYVVQDGDTLSSIASKYGLNADKLAALNNLTDASGLESGQRIRLR